MNVPDLTAEQRLYLIKEVYQQCYIETESFEKVGMGLVYLFGGIVTGTGYTLLDDLDPQEQEFYDLLKRCFESDHLVWKFIEIIGG